jgi:hypothetical protein
MVVILRGPLDKTLDSTAVQPVELRAGVGLSPPANARS